MKLSTCDSQDLDVIGVQVGATISVVHAKSQTRSLQCTQGCVHNDVKYSW